MVKLLCIVFSKIAYVQAVKVNEQRIKKNLFQKTVLKLFLYIYIMSNNFLYGREKIVKLLQYVYKCIYNLEYPTLAARARKTVYNRTHRTILSFFGFGCMSTAAAAAERYISGCGRQTVLAIHMCLCVINIHTQVYAMG